MLGCACFIICCVCLVLFVCLVSLFGFRSVGFVGVYLFVCAVRCCCPVLVCDMFRSFVFVLVCMSCVVSICLWLPLRYVVACCSYYICVGWFVCVFVCSFVYLSFVIDWYIVCVRYCCVLLVWFVVCVFDVICVV